jgi:hypothetical protein
MTIDQYEEGINVVITVHRSDELKVIALLWDATHSHPANSGIQPALHSNHHKASDEGKSAGQKEAGKVYYNQHLRSSNLENPQF